MTYLSLKCAIKYTLLLTIVLTSFYVAENMVTIIFWLLKAVSIKFCIP